MIFDILINSQIGLASINIMFAIRSREVLGEEIKNMNDRDHITLIGRPAALQTRPTTNAMLCCSASACQCQLLTVADALICLLYTSPSPRD